MITKPPPVYVSNHNVQININEMIAGKPYSFSWEGIDCVAIKHEDGTINIFDSFYEVKLIEERI